MDESRALQRAGWAGAASVVLLVVGVALCAPVGVDAPGVSDAAILESLDDGAKQAAAGIGLPVLGAGVALLLWFAVGLRGCWTGCPASTRLRTRSCRRRRCSVG
jgi:hypothetical protein